MSRYSEAVVAEEIDANIARAEREERTGRCDDCDGIGKVIAEFDFPRHKIECARCGGTGKPRRS